MTVETFEILSLSFFKKYTEIASLSIEKGSLTRTLK